MVRKLTALQRLKLRLKASGKTIAKGYGRGVRFVQKYAPKAERVFGSVARDVTESFQPQPSDPNAMKKTMGLRPQEKLEIDFSSPGSKVKIELAPKRRKMRGYVQLPIKKKRRMDFGSLSMDM